MPYLDQLHGVQPTTQGGGTLAIDGSGFLTANAHAYPGWTVDASGTHNKLVIDFGPGLINGAGYYAQFYLSQADYTGTSGIKAYGLDNTQTVIYRRDNSTIGTIGANVCRYMRLTFGAAGATGGTVEYGLDGAAWTTLGTFAIDAAITSRTDAAFGIDIYPGQTWAFLNTAPTITGLAVSLASTAVTGGQTVQATATATLSDNTTRAATSSEVTWTQTGGGSVNASGLSTAPATITGQSQSVTVTATRSTDSTMHAAATYTVPAGAPPAGVPTIRVRDGVTVLTSGATIDLGMQAGAGIKRRWFVVDNGNSTSTDEALTGLAATLASVAPWLTVGLDYTTAAAVLSVAATSPATVPGTPYVATDVHITSSVSGVQPFTLTIAGTVLAADSGAALMNELAARAARLDAMMTATLAAVSLMSDLDAQTRAALGSVPVAVQGGSADAIASKTQAAVGTQLTAISTAATGAQTAAQTAATAAGTAATAAGTAATTAAATETAIGFLPLAPTAAVVAAAVVGKQHDTEAFHALGTDGQPIAAAQTLRLQRTMPDGSPGHQIIYADANGATLGQSAVIAGA